VADGGIQSRGVATLAEFGLPQLPDPHPGHRGPLGGVLSGLRYFAPRRGWLLVVPCDAPFLPPDLAKRVSTCAQRAAAAANDAAALALAGRWVNQRVAADQQA
jgi:molybdopterin-guanine dinucleotide biosynthesis protein A